MAYWLYCQACKQWTKSSTPLSDDKTCSFCNILYVKAKPQILSQLNNVTTEKFNEPDDILTIPTTDDLTEKGEAPNIIQATEIKNQGTSNISKTPVEDDELPEEKISKPDISSKKQELSATPETLEIPKTPVNNNETAEIPEVLGSGEITEEQKSAVPEPPETTKTPADNDETAEIPEVLGSEEITEEQKSTVPEIPETTKTPAKDNDETAKISISFGSEEIIGEQKFATPETPEASAPLVDDDEKAARSEVLKSVEITDELEPAQTPEKSNEFETKKTAETSETPANDDEKAARSEEIETEETPEEDVSPDDEESDPPEPRTTPAHRLFIEDRRRKRNLR